MESVGATDHEVDAYPLITYTDGANDVRSIAPEPSGRTMGVRVELLDDGGEALIALMEERLGMGGHAGVICMPCLLFVHHGTDSQRITHGPRMWPPRGTEGKKGVRIHF